MVFSLSEAKMSLFEENKKSPIATVCYLPMSMILIIKNGMK